MAGQQVRQEVKAVAEEVKSLENKVDSFGNDALKALLNQGNLDRNIPIFGSYKHVSEADHGRCLVYAFRAEWRDQLPGAIPNDVYLLININALAVRCKEIYPGDSKYMTKAKFFNAFRDIGATVFSNSGEHAQDQIKEVKDATTTFLPTYKDLTRPAQVMNNYVVISATTFFKAAHHLMINGYAAKHLVNPRSLSDERDRYERPSGLQPCFNWEAPYPIFDWPMNIDGDIFTNFRDAIAIHNQVFGMPVDHFPAPNTHTISKYFKWVPANPNQRTLAYIQASDEEEAFDAAPPQEEKKTKAKATKRKTRSNKNKDSDDEELPDPEHKQCTETSCCKDCKKKFNKGSAKNKRATKKKQQDKPLPPIPADALEEDEHADDCQCKDCKKKKTKSSKGKAAKTTGKRKADEAAEQPKSKKPKVAPKPKPSSSSSSSSSSFAATPSASDLAVANILAQVQAEAKATPTPLADLAFPLSPSLPPLDAQGNFYDPTGQDDINILPTPLGGYQFTNQDQLFNAPIPMSDA